MDGVVNRQVVVNIVADDVQKAQESLLARQKKLNDEIKKTNDPKALADLNKQLKSTEQQLQRNEKVLKNELLPTYNQLTSAVKKYYSEFKKTGDPEVLKKYREVNAALQQTKVEMAGLEKASSGLTKGGIFSASFWSNLAANGVMKVTSALGTFFRGAISEALDADEATQRLNSTLSNLGRTDAFDRIIKKADELAEKFRYLDNDDIVGVFNKLIDYGKLTEKEMNNLLPVIIDFAAKSRISLEESTSVIVKALEGNGKALKEFGIDLKDAGDDTERLNVVMTTLKEKVDGSGEAFSKTAKGGIATARQEMKNLQEDIGDLVIPALNKVLNFVVRALKQLKTFFKDIKDGFRNAFSLRGIANIAMDRAKETAINQGRDEIINIGQSVIDTININADDKAFGIVDKAIGGKKTIPTKKKEVDELAQSIKDLGDVMEKELKRRDAAIRAGGSAGISVDFESGIDNAIGRARAGGNRSALAFLDLQVLKARGKKKLDAELALLKEQQKQELENKELTENQKLLIEEQYRQKRKDAEENYFQELVQKIAQYAKIVLDIISTFNEIQSQKENAELAKDQRINDQKIKNLNSRLKKGIISQKEYDRQVAEIEKQQEKRARDIAIRQFKRQQRISVIESIINTAVAVTEALANPLLAIAIGIAGAAKTALIASQKPPEFARGGVLGGRTHKQGGNAIVDGNGRKIAEIEKGEGIINRRSMADNNSYTMSGTPSQIASSLNSMNGRGVSWTTPAKYMNYGAINKRYYADGGVFDSGAGVSFSGSVDELTRLLAKGIKSYVVLTDLESAQDRLNSIRDDATMK